MNPFANKNNCLRVLLLCLLLLSRLDGCVVLVRDELELSPSGPSIAAQEVTDLTMIKTNVQLLFDAINELLDVAMTSHSKVLLVLIEVPEDLILSVEVNAAGRRGANGLTNGLTNGLACAYANGSCFAFHCCCFLRCYKNNLF